MQSKHAEVANKIADPNQEAGDLGGWVMIQAEVAYTAYAPLQAYQVQIASFMQAPA